jgi:hypothetical protein
MIQSGREGQTKTRFNEYQRPFIDLGRSLPDKAVVLLHTIHLNLGINRPILHDWLGFQSLIDARTFHNAYDLFHRLKELGVTHIVYEPGAAHAGTRQEEAIFAVFALQNMKEIHPYGPLRVFPMPTASPPYEPDYKVLLADVFDQKDGLYRVTDLSTLEELPARLRERRTPEVPLNARPIAELLARARVVLLGNDFKLDPADRQILSDRFDSFISYSDFTVHVRIR